jgi:hypothetical protein
MTGLPKWHGEMSDELNAVMLKYVKIARAEGCSDKDISLSLLAMWLNRLFHCTPHGGEKRTLMALSESRHERSLTAPLAG